MRSVALLSVLLLGGLTICAHATDYDLTVDPGAKNLLNSTAITVYEPLGLLKPGDHVFSVTQGPLPDPHMTCKVWLGKADGSSSINLPGTIPGYKGEVRLGKGAAPAGSVSAGLLMHVGTRWGGGEEASSSVLGTVKSGLFGKPWLWVLLAGLGVLAVLLAVLKFVVPNRGATQIYGKRAHEENLREVRAKLERVLEAQENLVRKPPVLRSFSKQIERFDSRLTKLETVAVTTQQALSVLANTVVTLESNVQAIADQGVKLDTEQRALDNTLQRLAGQVQSSAQAAKEQHEASRSDFAQSLTKVQADVQSLSELVAGASGSVQSLGDKLAKSDADNAEREQRSTSQIAAVQEGQSKLQALPEAVEELKLQLAGLAQAAQGYDERLDHVGQHLDALQSAQASLSNIPESVTKLTSELSELKALAHAQETAVAGLAGNFVELGANVATGEQLSALLDGQTSLASLPQTLSDGLSQLEFKIDAATSGAASKDQAEQLLERQSELLGLAKVVEAAAARLDTLAESSAGLDARLSELKQANDELNTGLQLSDQSSKAQLAEISEGQRNLLSANEQLKGLGADIEQLFKQAASTDQEVHTLVGLVDGLSGSVARTEQISELVQATEQALANAPSLAAIEARLSTLKGDGAASKENLKSLADLLNKLSVEVSKREQLENLLQNTQQNLQSLPRTLQTIEEKLAGFAIERSQSESSGAQVVVPELPALDELVRRQDDLESLLRSTKSVLDTLPASLGEVETQIRAISLTPGAPSEGTAVLADLLTRLEAQSASSEVANRESLDRVARELAALSDRVETVAAVANEAAQAAASRETVVVKQEAPAKAKQVESEPETPTFEPEYIEVLPKEVVAASPEHEVHLSLTDELEDVLSAVGADTAELELEEPLGHTVAIPDLVAEAPQEEEDDEAVAVGASSAGWESESGSGQNHWAVQADRPLKLADVATAAQALTPTETPGIEYPVGAILYSHGRVVYGHGDAVRGFWPGNTDKFANLSQSVPNGPWRLLVKGDRLFCALEKKVEIVDLGAWSKVATIAGDFSAQACTSSFWVGLKAGKAPSIEYHDLAGELSGKPVELADDFGTESILAVQGDDVYVGSQSGSLFSVNRDGATRLGIASAAAKAKLTHLSIYKDSLLAFVSEPNGVVARRLSFQGQVLNEARSEGSDVSGNPVVLGDRLYFFSNAQAELVVCDLKLMATMDTVPLTGTARVRKMVGIQHGKSHFLLIAGSDVAGQLGSVFLLDPKTGDKVVLCSTNQPLVDVIFARERAVVATSSSYQNIVRVFEPFLGTGAGEKRAA